MEGHDHNECRAFTNALMHEIARLSEREYVDEYVPARRHIDLTADPPPDRKPDGGAPAL